MLCLFEGQDDKIFLQKNTRPYKVLLSELESMFGDLVVACESNANNKDTIVYIYILLLCFQCAVVGYNLT